MNFLNVHSLNWKIVLVAILILTAVFFRFYKIRDYVVFLGDEGRDMIVMRNIFVNKDLPFLGPTASVGGFYLGPIYYWMAAPFLFLSRFDPVGPSFMVALFGLATVLLLYKFIKESLGFWPAILASFLYATAPLIVRYSRSSWNPNPLPFFSLLMVYATYTAIKNKNTLYYLISGAAFGISIQLHYLALILGPLIAAIIIINEQFKKIPFAAILIICGSIITFSPFLIFEIKNDFPNFKTILEFVTRGGTVEIGNNISWAIADSGNILLQWLSRLEGTIITRLFFWITSILVLAGAISFFKTSKKLTFSVGFIYFIGGISLITLYAGQLNDYYFGSIFPAPFIVFGLVVFLFWKKILTRIFILILFAVTLTFFVSNGFFRNQPNKLIDQTERISSTIIQESDSKPFNFALISPSNSDHAYRYFMEIEGKKPTLLEEQITDQLIVLCEQKDCAPLGHPIWEIAGFGMAEIEKELILTEYGFKLIKLTHHSSSKELIGKPAEKGI